MPARIIEGAPIAEAIKARVRAGLTALPRPPKLLVVQANDDPSARHYARSQRRACEEMGIAYELVRLPADSSSAEVERAIRQANDDAGATGVILVMPVPPGADRRRLQCAIHPDKDVEGVHPSNIGRLFHGDFALAPCTPHAVVTILRHAGVPLKGAETVVVGHSEIVGKPTLVMLLESVTEAPTVTCCHVATRDLAAHVRRAEVLVVAAGKAGLITADMVRPGAVVIDVGINRVETQEGGTRIVGDVDFEAVRQVAGAITPVPGGVGIVTTALLMQNLVECARRQQ